MTTTNDHTNPMESIPPRLNNGRWLTAYTAPVLAQRVARERVVLPICSLGTPLTAIEKLGNLLLPPLYHEALTPLLKRQLIERIEQCFPYYEGSGRRSRHPGPVEVRELAPQPPPPSAPTGIVAFSVDTAVEEHGPHLPLATDRIQSYALLQAALKQTPQLRLAPPLDYGHLIWGLAYGLSVDIPPALLTPYVTNYINAIVDWLAPAAVYVVDVHGAPLHREAIQRALEASQAPRKKFRWLYDPLVELTVKRGDMHGGGVETAMIEQINPQLIDPAWWPNRLDEIQSTQMSLPQAVELSKDLPQFIATAESTPWNGIVGRIENYRDVNADTMMTLATDTVREDLRELQSVR